MVYDAWKQNKDINESSFLCVPYFDHKLNIVTIDASNPIYLTEFISLADSAPAHDMAVNLANQLVSLTKVNLLVISQRDEIIWRTN